jgi:uncharacterized cupredoxin-like copper-binding protein
VEEIGITQLLVFGSIDFDRLRRTATVGMRARACDREGGQARTGNAAPKDGLAGGADCAAAVRAVSSRGSDGGTARLLAVGPDTAPAVARRDAPRTWLSLVIVLTTALAACDTTAVRTPQPTAGTVARPREVNVIAREYAYSPATLDVIPGETIVLHVVNAGLDIHEAIIGPATTQDAWESAEEGTADAPPGPTPAVSVPAGLAGLRLVVRSGERADATWTVPADVGGFVVGCHIPGHWAKGMAIPLRAVAP